MKDLLDPALINHLSQTTGLSPSTCERLALDVLAEYGETLESFVKRRHTELKATTDQKNEQIYAQILAEIPSRRFVAGAVSTRQIRRLIYG